MAIKVEPGKKCSFDISGTKDSQGRIRLHSGGIRSFWVAIFGKRPCLTLDVACRPEYADPKSKCGREIGTRH